MSEYSIQADLVCSPLLRELTARGGLLGGHLESKAMLRERTGHFMRQVQSQSTSPWPGGGVREQERDLVGAALT